LRWLRNDAVKETEHAGSDIIATMINGNIIIIMIIVVSNTEKKRVLLTGCASACDYVGICCGRIISVDVQTYKTEPKARSLMIEMHKQRSTRIMSATNITTFAEPKCKGRAIEN